MQQRVREVKRLLRDKHGHIQEVTALYSGPSNAVTLKLERGVVVTTSRWFFGSHPFRASVSAKEEAARDDVDLLEFDQETFTCGSCRRKSLWQRSSDTNWCYDRWLNHKTRCTILQEKYREELELQIELERVPPPHHEQNCRKVVNVAPLAARYKIQKRSVSVERTWRNRKRVVYVELTRRRGAKSCRPASSITNGAEQPANETSSQPEPTFKLGRVFGLLASWMALSTS